MDETPEFDLVIRSEGLVRSIKATQAALKNLKPALREFGKYLMEKLKKKMEARGDGTWPDYAPSTKAKREATGTGNITKFGKVRAGYLKKLVSYERFLKGKAKQEKAQSGDISEQTFDKLLNLENKIQKLRKRKEKVQNKAFQKRRVRKAMKSKEDMLGKLKSLNVRITGTGLKIGLLKGPEWAWRHNEGDGPIPKRQIVPEQLDAEDIEKLTNILGKHLIRVFENPSSKESAD